MGDKSRWMIGLGTGIVLASAAAMGCQHNKPAARHAENDPDRDRDHDEHHDEARREPALGAGIGSNMAVRSIANARCEREERCGNIGVDQDYATIDACEEKVKADWNEDLNKYECPNGIVQAELDECLADIKKEECGNPFDSLARMVSCNASDICDD